MQTLGRHLIADFFGCDPRVTNHEPAIRRALVAATRKSGATIIGEVFHSFAPQGVTGTVVIAESHVSVHTWPEHGYVSVDIFTCGGLDPRPAFVHLQKALKAREYRTLELVRGVDDDVEAGRSLLPNDVRTFPSLSALRTTKSVMAKQVKPRRGGRSHR